MIGCVFGCFSVVGCGGSGGGCSTIMALQVGPATGSADHAAAAPGNQFHFESDTAEQIVPGSGSNCAISAIALAVAPTWTSSDPVNVPVTNSTTPQIDGTVTCKAATANPVTLTAVFGTGPSAQTKTVQMSCK
jgi:hypothetical protein